ncbi:MAG: outer membrane protein transport protein [Nitrospirae bacterium]|nr:outer membrane protein transport protein [Nitrospirota bacterium]
MIRKSISSRFYALFSRIMFVSLVCFICSSSVFAYDPTASPFASSLNPVGSGARAAGMGGAFIGLADDATAASWNPAGLVQLEKPEVSAVYSYFNRSNNYSSSTASGLSNSDSMSANGLNYASFAYPFNALGRNWTVSLNYQRLYEMRVKADFNYTYNFGAVGSMNDVYNYNQTGYLYALSPAFAVQVTPELYFGATLNFWGDFLGDNGWKTSLYATGNGTLGGIPFTDTTTWNDKIKFNGFNANLGLMWNVNKFTIGAVYKIPFTGRLKSETSTREIQSAADGTYSDSGINAASSYLKMSMPASYGLGVAYRHSDNWIFDCDVYHTTWSSSYIKDSTGAKFNTLTGGPISDGRLKDTTQVRLGGEYIFILPEKTVIPVRVGFFYDPEPATTGTDTYYGFSVGTGYSSSKVSFDVSYQYRFGNNLNGGSNYIPGGLDVRQHTVMVSAVYYF